MKPRQTTANAAKQLLATANAGSASLRLWLEGYHTPSLNRTKGRHWGKSRKWNQGAAEAVYRALQGQMAGVQGVPQAVVAEAKRVLSRLVMGQPVEKPGRRRPKPETPARLRFERVTVSLLDEENFVGSTKGLTDCLRYAFPTLLIDDAQGYVEIEHVQTRCGSKCEQGTWLTLEEGRTEVGTPD